MVEISKKNFKKSGKQNFLTVWNLFWKKTFLNLQKAERDHLRLV